MNHSHLYATALEKVSRSFAFCIAELEKPFRDYVALAYILFRILDTIEDYPFAGKNKKDFFDCFHDLLEVNQSSGDFQNKIEVLRSALKEERLKHEKILADNLEKFFSDFHELPEELKSILHSSLVEMSLGMQYFLENSDSDELVLKSHRDLNQYCYFVAGLVGTYLNESYRYFYGKDLSGEKPTLDLLAIQFGLFLQKVNVLKDQLEDEKIGRKLISDREEVVDSLLPLAEKSFQYIKSISENLSGYRLFCAWSFFLGLASLPFVQKSFRERKEIKLPRIQAWKLLNRVKSALVDNFKLNEIYLELIEPIKSLAEIKNNCIDKKAANEEKHGKRISSDESTNSVVALLKLRYERFLNIKNPSSLSYREFESLGL